VSTPLIGREGLLRLVGWAEKLRARHHVADVGVQAVPHDHERPAELPARGPDRFCCTSPAPASSLPWCPTAPPAAAGWGP